jgi:hypothetical protein
MKFKKAGSETLAPRKRAPNEIGNIAENQNGCRLSMGLRFGDFIVNPQKNCTKSSRHTAQSIPSGATEINPV